MASERSSQGLAGGKAYLVQVVDLMHQPPRTIASIGADAEHLAEIVTTILDVRVLVSARVLALGAATAEGLDATAWRGRLDQLARELRAALPTPIVEQVYGAPDDPAGMATAERRAQELARLIPGTEVGAVLAVAGGLGAAFFSARDGMSVAEAAAGSFKTAMDGVNDTVGSGVTLADKLTKSYEGMSSGMRKLEGLRLARETREQTRAITEQRSALDALLEEIESAAAARLGAGLFREGGSAAWAVQPASSRATRRRLCRMQSPRSVPARSTPTSSPPSSSAWARPAPSSRS